MLFFKSTFIIVHIENIGFKFVDFSFLNIISWVGIQSQRQKMLNNPKIQSLNFQYLYLNLLNIYEVHKKD